MRRTFSLKLLTLPEAHGCIGITYGKSETESDVTGEWGMGKGERGMGESFVAVTHYPLPLSLVPINGQASSNRERRTSHPAASQILDRYSKPSHSPTAIGRHTCDRPSSAFSGNRRASQGLLHETARPSLHQSPPTSLHRPRRFSCGSSPDHGRL